MAENKQGNSRGRAIFDLVFTALLVGISMGAGPVGIIAMQYTSDRISYWHGAIGGSSLAVLVVAGYLLYQDWKGPRRIFRKASEPGAGEAGERDRPGSGETPGASNGGTG
ncbi:MAG: hypothetical protein P8174_00425 [Gemmatimonadota bacterium]|jgi:hypothetical protein